MERQGTVSIHKPPFKVWYSNYKDKTVGRPTYIYNRNPYIRKTVSWYWDGPMWLHGTEGRSVIQRFDYFFAIYQSKPLLKWTFDEHSIDDTAVWFLQFVAQLISVFGQGDTTWLKACVNVFLRNHKNILIPSIIILQSYDSMGSWNRSSRIAII